MIDKKLVSVLKKIYSRKNEFYDHVSDRYEHSIPQLVTNEDLRLLTNNGLKPNNFEVFEHDNVLNRLLEYRSHSIVSLNFATSMFLKGISGEFPRGRQVLMSYVSVINLVNHQFEGKDNCEVCGLPKRRTQDKTEILFSQYLGHSWNEERINHLIDLDEISTHKKPIITDTDKLFLLNLLNFISIAPANETPSQLEKRIAKSNLLPGTEKYKRYGILLTLAECGILSNNYISPAYNRFSTQRDIWNADAKTQSPLRSDIGLPLSGWRGEDGVDFDIYEKIFDS